MSEMASKAKKRCPRDVEITDTTTKAVYKPGQFLPHDMWTIFEDYVTQEFQRAAPDWQCETQVEREVPGEQGSRTDIEMTRPDDEIVLIECKHYNDGYLSKKDVEKMVRDRKVSGAILCITVISHTTKCSDIRREQLKKEDIRLLVAQPGWEQSIHDVLGTTPEVKPGGGKDKHKPGRYTWKFLGKTTKPEAKKQ